MKELTAENKIELINRVNGIVKYDDKKLTKTAVTAIASVQSCIIHNIIYDVSNTNWLNDLCFMWDTILSCIEQERTERHIAEGLCFALPRIAFMTYEQSPNGAIVKIDNKKLNEKDRINFTMAARNMIRALNYWKPEE